MKRLCAIILSLTLLLTTQYSYAKDHLDNQDKIISTIGLNETLKPPSSQVISVYEPKNAQPYASKKTSFISSFLFFSGEPEIAKYRRTDYSVKEYNMLSSTTNTREQKKVWLTLARGESRQVSYSTEVHCNVKIKATVKAGVSFLINSQLDAEVDGGIKYQYTVNKTMSGPDTNSSYNCRKFYHAVDYMQYGFVMNKTDVYAIYDSSNNFLRYEYIKGTVNVPRVEKPYLLSWSEDLNIY